MTKLLNSITITSCPCTLECFLLDEIAKELDKDNYDFSLSQKRRVQVELQEHKESYCNNQENRKNCPFFKTYSKHLNLSY
jgi:hypothetical protein